MRSIIIGPPSNGRAHLNQFLLSRNSDFNEKLPSVTNVSPTFKPERTSISDSFFSPVSIFLIQMMFITPDKHYRLVIYFLDCNSWNQQMPGVFVKLVLLHEQTFPVLIVYLDLQLHIEPLLFL